MMASVLNPYTGVGRKGAIPSVTLLVFLIPLATAQIVGPGALVMGGGGRGGSASFGSHSFNIHEAPVGFFVDGSSITAMNGVYGPKVCLPIHAVRMLRVSPRQQSCLDDTLPSLTSPPPSRAPFFKVSDSDELSRTMPDSFVEAVHEVSGEALPRPRPPPPPEPTKPKLQRSPAHHHHPRPRPQIHPSGSL